VNIEDLMVLNYHPAMRIVRFSLSDSWSHYRGSIYLESRLENFSELRKVHSWFESIAPNEIIVSWYKTAHQLFNPDTTVSRDDSFYFHDGYGLMIEADDEILIQFKLVADQFKWKPLDNQL